MPESFRDGNPVTAAQLETWFQNLRGQGQEVLDALEQARQQSLVLLNNRLSAVNARRRRADSLLPAETGIRFSVADFSAIDQQLTTATVRADTMAATLAEQAGMTTLTRYNQVRFSSSATVVEALDATGTLYRVASDSAAVWGQFDIDLGQSLSLGMVLLDLAAPIADPTITVSASATGTGYSEASQVSLSGYRVAAWFTGVATRYLRIRIAPTHSDSLTGNTYTFGLTDLAVTGVEYSRSSVLVTKPIAWTPRGHQLRFVADDSGSGLEYHLSFYTGSTLLASTAVASGETVSLPGVTAATVTGVTASAGVLAQSLPSDLYPRSLRLWQEDPALALAVVWGLTSNPRVASASQSWASVSGNQVTLGGRADVSKRYTLSYASGPADYRIQLQVIFASATRAASPIFRGAFLEYV